MSPRVARTLVLFVLWLAASPGAAQIYRWTDANGALHFTQDLTEVPADQREAAAARWTKSDARINITGVAPTRPPSTRPTSSSLEAAPVPSATPTNATSRTSAASEAAARSVHRPGGKPESWWRGRHRALSTRVVLAEKKIASIEAAGSLPASFKYSRRARRDRDRARWEKNKAKREAKREKTRALAEANVALAKARQDLTAFREQARRADVPPGWLRD